MISKAKFDRIYHGQTSVAKKVYAGVPIMEAWSPGQIAAELKRTNVSMDLRILSGCLATLVDAGLVKEVAKGEYRREAIREVSVKELAVTIIKKESQLMAKIQTNMAPIKPQSPLDKLGELAERATSIQRMAEHLANDIADAAVEIQAHIESEAKKMEKYKQLSSILKSLEVEAES